MQTIKLLPIFKARDIHGIVRVGLFKQHPKTAYQCYECGSINTSILSEHERCLLEARLSEQVFDACSIICVDCGLTGTCLQGEERSFENIHTGEMKSYIGDPTNPQILHTIDVETLAISFDRGASWYSDFDKIQKLLESGRS